MARADVNQLSELERAIRFFILNRITFSGTIEAGGYSNNAFEQRFTPSSIDRLSNLGQVLQGVKITNLDFREVVQAEGKNEGDNRTFIFLDPPYLSTTKSKLYGKRGHYHSQFDHTIASSTMSVLRRF